MKPGNSHSNSPAVLATLGVSLLSLPVLMKWAWLLPLQLCRETVATSWDSMEHKAGRQADSQLGPSRSHCGGLRCVLFGSVQQEAVPQSPRLALWWQTRLGAFQWVLLLLSLPLSAGCPPSCPAVPGSASQCFLRLFLLSPQGSWCKVRKQGNFPSFPAGLFPSRVPSRSTLSR